MARMAERFGGKVALVTGGSRGIGAGIVRRLAVDGAGVAFTYATSGAKAQELVREVEAGGGNAIAFKADSGSAEELQNVVNQTVSKLGSLDIFVSNAGILKIALLDQFTLEDFDQMVLHQRAGRLRWYPGRCEGYEGRWPHHHDRKQYGYPNRLSRSKRIYDDEVCAYRTCSRRRDRSRTTLHYSQQYPTWSHSHRHEFRSRRLD